jgi:hypothetical protein
MTKYSHIHLDDSTPQLSKGWYDTDAFKYSNLPPIEELREMSDEEWESRHDHDHYHEGNFVKRPAPSEKELAERAQDLARRKLDESKEIVLQCYEDSIPVPEEWKNYRSTLRAIINGNGSLVLPEPPKS